MTTQESQHTGAAPLRAGVLGAAGQLGRCLVRAIEAAPDFVLAFAFDHAAFDLADPEACRGLPDRVAGGMPDVLFNAAAFTAVDRCESERETAMAVNAQGPGLLAEVCAKSGTHLVHVSTDYVFDGQGARPYPVDAPTAPRSVYGQSKLAGEAAVATAQPAATIVRTSWVFGPGRNFPAAILGQARLRRSGEVHGPLRVVDDQRGAPTYAADLAEGLLALARAGLRDGADVAGIFHLSNAGEISWWDFARAILDETGHGDLEIERGRTADLGLAAERPAYSVLDGSRAAALGVRLRPWREALCGYLSGPDRPEALQAGDENAKTKASR